MSSPLVLVTGFGPFPGTERNPSREVARLLERDPPHGARVVARELPVTFRGAPLAVRQAVEELGERPAFLLGLGVQPEPGFRLEKRARGRFEGRRMDNDGVSAGELALSLGEDLEVEHDLAPLALVLAQAGASTVRISEDAGGYVCDRTFRELLECGRVLGVPAFFLHVPPAEHMEAHLQAPIVRALVAGVLAALPANNDPEQPRSPRAASS